ncbi:hypothetical protein T05_14668 [Trichinella murrelli]|uniref:Uncharacterized protein n=1 Tax=Trichinella murrelli TaxID=144512 RepID=A0A0V0THZ6_9BILA|nr:hypothetical protein T05_14668 [Trichinella murrelli]
MNPSSLYRSQFSLSLCTECQRFPFPPFSISATSTKPIFHHLSAYPITNDKISMQNDNRAARQHAEICPIEQL